MYETEKSYIAFLCSPVGGRVIISAQVDTKGNLSQCKVMMSDDPLFDKEALRVVKLMPRFVPDGEGKVVSGSVEIPVMFRLN